MAAPKLPAGPTLRLLEAGYGPTQVAAYLDYHYGVKVTPQAVSAFRRRHTDIPPKHSVMRVVPWAVKKEHAGSIYRHAILAWNQRENDCLVSVERIRNLTAVEARLYRDGQVIHYDPAEGFVLVSRRTGVDLGIIREPDETPHPPTRGPYCPVATTS